MAALAHYLGARPAGGQRDTSGSLVRGICDDSRTVSAGDAYVAISGQRCHGLDFADDARAAGAVLIISDRPSAVLPTIVVDDPRTIIGPLCSWFYQNPSQALRVFGVTGTNGKTSTTHFLEAGLRATGQTVGLISGVRIKGPGCDLVPERTTPEAPTLHRTLAHFRREGVTACAMEISSHAVDQHRVDAIAYRAMAFTNLGRDHLDYHGTMNNYFATKASMFTADRTEIAVVNIDDTYGSQLAATATAPDIWTCAITDHRADVYAHRISLGAAGSRFTVHTPAGSTQIRLQTLGPHQVSNALVALTTLLADGVPLDTAAQGLSSLHGVRGRCEPVHAGQPFTAIVDYMHNTAGQRALLPYLRSLTAERLILVAGATGGRDPGKRQPLGFYAARHADLLIITDESPHNEDPATIRAQVLRGAHHAQHATIIEEPDRRLAIDLAVAAAAPGDVLVIAGRGSDTRQHFGTHTTHFDDHTQLHQSITTHHHR